MVSRQSRCQNINCHVLESRLLPDTEHNNKMQEHSLALDLSRVFSASPKHPSLNSDRAHVWWLATAWYYVIETQGLLQVVSKEARRDAGASFIKMVASDEEFQPLKGSHICSQEACQVGRLRWASWTLCSAELRCFPSQMIFPSLSCTIIFYQLTAWGNPERLHSSAVWPCCKFCELYLKHVNGFKGMVKHWAEVIYGSHIDLSQVLRHCRCCCYIYRVSS